MYYDTDGSGYPYANSVSTGSTGTSYTLTGLTTDGHYYLAVAAVDSDGNESWVSNEITFVIDNTAPTIALIGDSTITHEAGTLTYGVDSGAYSASDAAGNAATSVTRTVTVADTTAPVITLTGLASVTHELGTTYADAGATSDENRYS